MKIEKFSATARMKHPLPTNILLCINLIARVVVAVALVTLKQYYMNVALSTLIPIKKSAIRTHNCSMCLFKLFYKLTTFWL